MQISSHPPALARCFHELLNELPRGSPLAAVVSCTHRDTSASGSALQLCAVPACPSQATDSSLQDKRSWTTFRTLDAASLLSRTLRPCGVECMVNG